MGACVFCGGGPVTKEHVWPKWLRNLVQEKHGEYLMGIVDDPSQQRSFTRLAFDHTVKRLCARCNNVWLGQGLEAQTKPLLTTLISGQSRRLTGADQALLTTWFYKTALMVSLTIDHEATYIPPAQYHAFRATTEPPSGTVAWIGRWDAGQQRARYNLQRYQWWDRETPDIEEEGWQFVLGVLGVAAVVIAQERPERLPQGKNSIFSLGGLGHSRLLQLWPASASFSVTWPPSEILATSDVEELARVLRAMGSGSTAGAPST